LFVRHHGLRDRGQEGFTIRGAQILSAERHLPNPNRVVDAHPPAKGIHIVQIEFQGRNVDAGWWTR
jgi:hypothetical protein